MEYLKTVLLYNTWANVFSYFPPQCMSVFVSVRKNTFNSLRAAFLVQWLWPTWRAAKRANKQEFMCVKQKCSSSLNRLTLIIFISFWNWPQVKSHICLFTLLKTSNVLRDTESNYFCQFPVLEWRDRKHTMTRWRMTVDDCASAAHSFYFIEN